MAVEDALGVRYGINFFTLDNTQDLIRDDVEYILSIAFHDGFCTEPSRTFTK